MKNTVAQPIAEAVTEEPVHFMKKSRKLISSRHIDLDNLTAFEATAMTMALVLAVVIGVLGTSVA